MHSQIHRREPTKGPGDHGYGLHGGAGAGQRGLLTVLPGTQPHLVDRDGGLFFQVTDPRAADDEIVDYPTVIEQLSATLRTA